MKIQPLSILFKQCKLPNISKDIFGDPLTCKNASDIFIKGQDFLITDYNKNFKRPQPLEFYINKETIGNYLKQFKDMCSNFDSFGYISSVRKLFDKV